MKMINYIFIFIIIIFEYYTKTKGFIPSSKYRWPLKPINLNLKEKRRLTERPVESDLAKDLLGVKFEMEVTTSTNRAINQMLFRNREKSFCFDLL
jgi:hypothetical protein